MRECTPVYTDAN